MSQANGSARHGDGLEREITTPTPLTDGRGRLNHEAVGWMRRPLLDTSGIDGRRSWGRNKRWEYWCVMTPTHIMAATVSSIDYAGVHEVWVFDRETEESIGHGATVPFARGVELPASLGDGPARAGTREMRIEITDAVQAAPPGSGSAASHNAGTRAASPGTRAADSNQDAAVEDSAPGAAEAQGMDAAGTRLRASAPRVRFDVTAETPPGHECLGVVVPWSDTRFQYTVKDVARPASGTLWIDDVAYDVPAGHSWAVLDHGRGRWPYNVRWNWGAGSGECDGHAIGIQIGGQWTVGTGSTENAFVLDGRLHKISHELRWQYDTADYLQPWRITGDDIDLTFEPFYDKVTRTNLGVLQSHTDQCFGTYSGWFRDADGDATEFAGIEGWAEKVHNRW
ncbi:DUF2804 domain-containing protein [Microbacterium sp. MPKO10]|uniref:DUF2804 domain-containing protein n=1 Tax=Microbacterium sp. MPKO10 TaxID=2989818 RepID=UPI002235E1D6|nr:DUF2804 domain-containing protein [Microbacterium sp. MPKO10]MCW4457182.1 DUF2804 domain-containing protein [Microbacterium sp. MPKO10]